MKHLLICREYPPAPSGGIGTYAVYMSRLLSKAGETVHVIAQLWKGAERSLETLEGGRLLIHRVPFLDWKVQPAWRPHKLMESAEALGVYESTSPALAFGWQACELAEKLIETEGIDLVEAQEFEAPLYFLQLRRALGLGPERKPPCLVHLHSPTEYITIYNGEDPNAPYRLVSKRLEDFSITSADALLCPSNFLARAVEAQYAMESGTVKVLRLPAGDIPLIRRSEATWKSGPVLFVGRLAPQKGVIEWVEAAVSVAREFPEATFEFVGGDIPYSIYMNQGVLGFLYERIPSDLRHRFIFHHEQKREKLEKFLQRARIAVIPSRFENYPYTCVESMSSGLAVIASPCGGMAEMVEDGVSGWVAETQSASGLAGALRRALQTPPEKLQAMGEAAAKRIGELSDNEKITQAHLEYRSELVRRGAGRSLCLPPILPWARQGYSAPLERQSAVPGRKGIGVVITCYNLGRFLGECLESVKEQTTPPAAVVVVDDGSNAWDTQQALARATREGWEVFHQANAGLAAARNAGARYLNEAPGGSELAGYVFLDADDKLCPDYIETMEKVLSQRPEVGLLSCWTHHFYAVDRAWVQPCPAFPYQWLSNEAATFSVVRAEAFEAAGGFRKLSGHGYEDWDLFNAVMAQGWVAVNVPRILGEYRVREDSMLRQMSAHAHGRMRKELFDRLPELVARDAQDIALMSDAIGWWTIREEVFTLRASIARARQMIRRPHLALRWAARKAVKKLLK